jgi:hypothetical protein
MIPLKKNELLILTSLIILAAAIAPLIFSTSFEGRSITATQISYAQQNVMNQTSAGFRSVFNTFVVPGSSHGYGVYEEHKSNVFKPGEKVVLYIEPVGFTHRPITGTNKSETLYLSNFTADVVISDKTGKVLGGVQNFPISEILSHHKNNEISLTVSLTQSNPFPVGDYVVKYLIRDVPSGTTFQIVKNIKVANA